MKSIDANKTARLNIVARKNVSFSLTVKNEVAAGATYECKVFYDDDTIALTLTVTASGQNLIVSHQSPAIPTGNYRYTLTRTVSAVSKRILEGNFTLKP